VVLSLIRAADTRGALLAVLATALVLRLGVFWLNSPFPPPSKDAAVYEALATNLIEGNGFSGDTAPPFEPLFFRTPGYPAFVGLIHVIAGRSLNAVRIVQIGLSLVTCLLTYAVGRRLLGHRLGAAAAAVYAILPPAVSAPSWILTEANQALLLTLAVYSACRIVDAPRDTPWYLALGTTLGYASLCRPDHQYLLLFLLGGLALIVPGVRANWRGPLVATTCVVVVVTPWMVRNYLLLGRHVGLSTGAGHVAMAATIEAEGKRGQALYDALEARYGEAFRRTHGRPMTYIDGALPDQDEIRKRDFIDFVGSQPLRYARHVASRVYWLWLPRSWSDAVGIDSDFSELLAARRRDALGVKLGLLAIDALVIGLAGLGFLFALLEFRRFGPIVVTIAYGTVVYGLVAAYARYRVPFLPLVAVLAVLGAAKTYDLVNVRLGLRTVPIRTCYWHGRATNDAARSRPHVS